jgi:hypothetical protein
MSILGLLIVFVALCCVAGFVPMPQGLKVGLWCAAGIVLLIILLALCGALPDISVRPRSVVVNP